MLWASLLGPVALSSWPRHPPTGRYGAEIQLQFEICLKRMVHASGKGPNWCPHTLKRPGGFAGPTDLRRGREERLPRADRQAAEQTEALRLAQLQTAAPGTPGAAHWLGPFWGVPLKEGGSHSAKHAEDVTG